MRPTPHWFRCCLISVVARYFPKSKSLSLLPQPQLSHRITCLLPGGEFRGTVGRLDTFLKQLQDFQGPEKMKQLELGNLRILIDWAMSIWLFFCLYFFILIYKDLRVDYQYTKQETASGPQTLRCPRGWRWYLGQSFKYSRLFYNTVCTSKQSTVKMKAPWISNLWLSSNNIVDIILERCVILEWPDYHFLGVQRFSDKTIYQPLMRDSMTDRMSSSSSSAFYLFFGAAK